MRPENPKARVRLNANIRQIRSYLADLEKHVDYMENEDRVDFGHVGDLAYIRKQLSIALTGEEDEDPK